MEKLTKEQVESVLKVFKDHTELTDANLYYVKQALESIGEEEKEYTEHFLEWRNKYWTKQEKILLWKSKSKHLTTDELHAFYNKAFLLTEQKI